MKNIKEWLRALDSGALDSYFRDHYNREKIRQTKSRYRKLLEKVQPADAEYALFSVPGRTELGGNHTDHNLGKVLTAGIDLDIAAVVKKENTREVTIYSDALKEPVSLSLDELAPREEEQASTAALVRGVGALLVEAGYSIGGFTATLDSTIPFGAGLSSSAAVEVLIGAVFNALYNGGRIPREDLAVIGQKAENIYFRKPCGLMDQLACAMGGILKIDFKIPGKPETIPLDYSFSDHGYQLGILNTGKDHSGLKDMYGAIPSEMRKVAACLGVEYLGQSGLKALLKMIPEVRRKLGDRPLLRAFHFFNDSARVDLQIKALEENSMAAYLQLVRESGASSWMELQNCIIPGSIESQEIALAVSLTNRFTGLEGAARVHGSGFMGAVQVYIPLSRWDEYKEFIENIFGESSLIPLFVRHRGVGFIE